MEVLDAEVRPRSRTVWFVLGAVVLLLGTGLVRLVGPARPPGPAPASSAGPPVRAVRNVWPQHGEIGSGTLLALSDGEVHRIDVADGRLETTGVRPDAIDTRLTRVQGGVLVWLASGGAQRRLIRSTDPRPRPVRGALRTAETFLAGEGGAVWTATGRAASGGTTTWQLVGRDGDVTAEVEVSGRAASDGAGGLLDVEGDGFRQVHPPPAGPLVTAELIGSGPDGYLSRTCTDDGRCTARLHDPATGEARVVGLAPPMEALPGTVSPGNRFVTLGVLGEPTGAIQVRELGSPRVLRSFIEDGAAGGSAAWLSDRWVALISGNGGIVLYDAVGDEAIRPELPLTTTVQQLVWCSA